MPHTDDGEKTMGGRVLRPTLHLLIALSLTFSFCLGVNELKINHYETIHRLSVQNTVEFTLVSKELDGYINSTLIMLFILLTVLELARGREPLRPSVLLNLVLSSASLISFLTGFETASFILLASAYSIHLFLKKESAGFLNTYMCLLIVIEALSLLRWVTYPLLYSPVYKDSTWFFSRLDSLTFYVFDSLLGNLMILTLLFSFPLSILPFIRRVRLENRRIRLEISRVEKPVEASLFHSRLLDWRIILASSFLILLYLSYLPYSPSLNPSGKPVSVDIVFYQEYLDTLKQLGLSSEGANYLLGKRGERAVAILLTYLVSLTSSLSSMEAVKASLFIASCLLILASYFSLKSATGSKILASLSAPLSIFSVQTVVGLYAGYLANMVATPLLLLTTLCFSRAVEGERRFLFFSILLSTVALYTHPWSWAIFILAILLLIPLNMVLSLFGLRKRYGRSEILIILMFTLVNLAMDFSKQLLFKSVGGIYAEYAVAKSSLSFSNLFLLGRNLDELRQILVGGYTSNLMIYVFSIVGAIFLLTFNNPFFDSLFLMLPIAAAPFMFVDKTVQSRLLYVLPTNIYMTIGLYEALKRLDKKGVDHRLLATLVLLSLANYGFRSVANLV